MGRNRSTRPIDRIIIFVKCVALTLLLFIIEVKDVSGGFQQEDSYLGINLTWDGQDFLNAARDDRLWAKAKEAVINSGVGTVQSLLAWLKAQVLM